MATRANIGIDFLVNDSKTRSAVAGMSKFMIAEAAKVEAAWAKVGKTTGSASGGSRGGSGGGTKPDDPAERARAHKAATDLMAQQEARYAKIQEQYRGKNAREEKALTAELIDNIKRLQNEKISATNAARLTDDKAAKQRLARVKGDIDAEIRMLRAAANEKKGVQTGGMGAKAGILGTGRGLTGIAGDLGGGIAAAGPYVAFAAGMKKVIDIGGDFQTSMLDMQALVDPDGKAGINMQAMSQIARDLGQQFGTGASGGAESMKLTLSSLGPDLAKDADAFKSVATSIGTLSSATDLTLAESATSITGIMGQYGEATGSAAEQAKSAARIMNELAAGSKVGNAEVLDLKESMEKVGAVANMMGQSTGQTVAALEVLGAVEIKGSEAGTQLRGVYLGMAAGGKAQNEALAQMGLTFNDINPKVNGFKGGLDHLKGGLDKIKDPVQKAAIMTKIFGRENIAAGEALLQGTEKLGEFEKGIIGTNTANEQAAIKQQGFQFQMKQFMATLEDVAITIFEALAPALSVVGEILPYIAKFVGWVVEAFIWWHTAIYDAYMAVVQFLGEATGITDWIESEVIPWIEKMVPIVKEGFSLWLEQAKAVGSYLIDFLKPILAGIIDVATWLWKNVLVPFGAFIVGTLVVYFKALVAVATFLYENVLRPLGEYIGGAFASAWRYTVTQFNNAKVAVNWLVTAVKDAWAWMVKAAGAVADWARNVPILSSAFRGVVSALQWVIDKLEKAYEAGRALASLAGLGGGPAPPVRANNRSNAPTPGGTSAVNTLRRMGNNFVAPPPPTPTGGGSGGAGGGEDDKEKKKREKEEAASRKRQAKDAATAAAEAKAAAKKVIDDKAATARLAAQQEFFEGKKTKEQLARTLLEIDLAYREDSLAFAKKYHDDEIAAETEFLAARQALKDETEKRRKDVADGLEDQRKKGYADDLDALDKWLTQEQDIIEQQGEDVGAIEEQTNLFKLDAERSYWERKLALAIMYGENIEAVEKAKTTADRARAKKEIAERADLAKKKNKEEEKGNAVSSGLMDVWAVGQKKMLAQASDAWSGYMQGLGVLGEYMTPLFNTAIGELSKFVTEYIEIAAKWVAKNMEAAVSSLIMWQLAAGWWNLLLIPGEIAALYGMFELGKELFAHAEGGITKGPLFTQDRTGAGHVAGEAGPEVIAPLGGLLGMIKRVVENATANKSSGGLLADPVTWGESSYHKGAFIDTHSDFGLSNYTQGAFIDARSDFGLSNNVQPTYYNQWHGREDIGTAIATALRKEPAFVTVLDQRENILSLDRERANNAIGKL